MAFPSGEEARPAEGELTFIDNAVDVRMTMARDLPERGPGFGPASSSTCPDSPDRPHAWSSRSGSGAGQQGDYVFVVKMPESPAELRPVTAGRTVDGLTVIERGLQTGEVVVTDGQLRLVPGTRVEVKQPAPVAKQ